MNKVKLKFLRKILSSKNDDKEIKISFYKKDGSERTMLIKQSELANQNYVGADSAKKRKENYPNLVTVWDNENKGIRSIDLERVFRVEIEGGIVYDYPTVYRDEEISEIQ